jgi:hypothetical protein
MECHFPEEVIFQSLAIFSKKYDSVRWGYITIMVGLAYAARTPMANNV